MKHDWPAFIRPVIYGLCILTAMGMLILSVLMGYEVPR